MEVVTPGIELHEGDCLAVLPTLAAGSVDAVVTDPPYGIGFMGKQWDTPGSFVERKPERRNRFDHVGGNHNPSDGFDRQRTQLVEGCKFQAWCEGWASAALRVLKPGGYLLAFGGTRTYHRLTCAVEDAGFEVRDCLMWLYGTGFPKGQGCLKPAWEPILLARRPGKRVLPLGIDECRIATTDKLGGGAETETRPAQKGNDGWVRPWMDDPAARSAHAERVRANVQKAEALGRYPANVLHDGSDEVLAAFAAFGEKTVGGPGKATKRKAGAVYAQDEFTRERMDRSEIGYGDTGTAARFFYCAKASRSERGPGNTHPTVKPLALMRWLVRLVTSPGDVVLDPFAGSGTTAEASRLEGRRAVLIERDPGYCDIVRRRLAGADSGSLFRDEVTPC